MNLFAPLFGTPLSRLALAVFATFFLTTPTVMAETTKRQADRDEDYVQRMLDDAPRPFNGSFRELSARGGPLLPSARDSSVGWTADLGFRNALPMYIGDNRLAYTFGNWSMGERSAQQHGLHATLGLHPFYLALLSEGWRSHFLASLHLELGIGPRLARLSEERGQDGAGAMTQWGLAGSVGGGFDLPLTSPNQGKSLWINVLYRRSWSSLDFDADGATGRLHDHSFFFGLAWRNNGTLW